jgi:hypothetical protein
MCYWLEFLLAGSAGRPKLLFFVDFMFAPQLPCFAQSVPAMIV